MKTNGVIFSLSKHAQKKTAYISSTLPKVLLNSFLKQFDCVSLRVT